MAEAFHYFRNLATQIGLEFNTAKCEVIPAAGHRAILNKSLFPEDIIFRDDEIFELLVPIHSVMSISK